MQDVGTLYEKYATLVYKYLLSLCHDVDLAEEMTQETFFRAVEKIQTYQNNGNSKISTWLCQIAKHVWFQYLDKHKKLQTDELPFDLTANRALEPEEQLTQQETKIAVYKAILALPEPQRSVMQLRITGDLSFAEIGDILEKSENWARVTYFRAKEKIAKTIFEHGGPSNE